MRRWLGALVLAGIGAGAFAAWRLVRPDRDHYEEPAYTVEQRFDGFDVRRYASTIEARVTLPGSRRTATREGFRVLAGYIFGGNRRRESIAMTTPVSTAPSETIAMTTPVSARATGDGWTVAFTMPSRWTLDTLPVPDDDRVDLVASPGRLAAVRTFSGRATDAQSDEQERLLRERLREEGLPDTGSALLAQFDPPWVLGPWRRNEVQIGLPDRRVLESGDP